MSLLSSASEIWELRPTADDLRAAAKYAAITLPWTFNRMMLNMSSQGQQQRALNIAKGIAVQEVLKRALTEQGIKAVVQRKSHRADDLFDFHVPIDGKLVKLDVKSQSHYKDYSTLGRKPLDRALLIKYADYSGADWRQFFPNLVPHTQIKQEKEAYCFAITSSIDFRRDIDTDRRSHALTAFPYGVHVPFLMSRRLCEARESAGYGIEIKCSYSVSGLFDAEAVTLAVIGEWDGNVRTESLSLKSGKSVTIGPFSCIDSIQIDRENYDRFNGTFSISVARNRFAQAVLSASRQNINSVPRKGIEFTQHDFCNLILPSDFVVFAVGWMPKAEFLDACRNYTGWIWPSGAVDKNSNQPWTQITQSDRQCLVRNGFEDRIQKKPPLLKAGWMKTHGKGGGACCYVYPGIGFRGGVKETNLYTLPQDVHTIVSLGK